MLAKGQARPEILLERWGVELDSFREVRKRYLLY
jgi:hypothetical protein